MLLLPVLGVGRVQPGVGHLGRGVRVGCGRRDEGARGRSASADETIIQPRMRRREVGNSATFGALTGHAAGLLGDGALGDCVQAAGQRGGGAENTGHGLAAEVRSLPSVTEEGGKTEKTRSAASQTSLALSCSIRMISPKTRVNAHSAILLAAWPLAMPDNPWSEFPLSGAPGRQSSGALFRRRTERFDQILTESHS